MVLFCYGTEQKLNTRCSQSGKSFNIMTLLNRIVLALPCIVLALAGCSGTPPPNPHSVALAVSPSSTIVAAGSTTTFIAVFTPSRPAGGSLTWAITPATGGTITSKGVYTASGTVGQYTVVATWTAFNLAKNGTFNSSASVEILPVPQLDAVLNPDMVEASGAAQKNHAIQNAVVIGQAFPFLISADPSGNIEVQNGFSPPVECPDSSTVC